MGTNGDFVCFKHIEAIEAYGKYLKRVNVTCIGVKYGPGYKVIERTIHKDSRGYFIVCNGFNHYFDAIALWNRVI
jgi:hypothetical protein